MQLLPVQEKWIKPRTIDVTWSWDMHDYAFLKPFQVISTMQNTHGQRGNIIARSSAWMCKREWVRRRTVEPSFCPSELPKSLTFLSCPVAASFPCFFPENLHQTRDPLTLHLGRWMQGDLHCRSTKIQCFDSNKASFWWLDERFGRRQRLGKFP